MKKIIDIVRWLKYSYLAPLFPKRNDFMSKICRHHIRRGDVVLDVGSNNGDTALMLSSLVGRTGRVLGFEPNFDLYNRCRVIERGNLYRNITFYNFGIGNVNEEAVFFIDQREGAQASSFDSINIESERRLNKKDFYKESTARIVRLDDLAIEKVNFIKIDVEGYEMEVLKGARCLIEKQRPTIVFELFVDDRSEELIKRKSDFIYFFNNLNYDLNIRHVFTDQPFWKDKSLPKSLDNFHFPLYTGLDIEAVPL